MPLDNNSINIKGLMTYLLTVYPTDIYIIHNGFRIVTHELFDCFVQESQ